MWRQFETTWQLSISALQRMRGLVEQKALGWGLFGLEEGYDVDEYEVVPWSSAQALFTLPSTALVSGLPSGLAAAPRKRDNITAINNFRQ